MSKHLQSREEIRGHLAVLLRDGNANSVGELLRSATFTCPPYEYTSLHEHIRPDAKIWLPDWRQKFLAAIGEIDTTNEDEFERLEAERLVQISHGCTFWLHEVQIDALWFRDGDTVLFFRIQNGANPRNIVRTLINTDAKKDYVWRDLVRPR